MPLCWSVIIVARDPGTNTYRADRGTLSLAPAWFRPDRCASYRLAGDRLRPVGANDEVAWRDDFRQSVTTLRNFDRDDCRVRAWLQFGRAPIVRDNMILDLRFDTGLRGTSPPCRLRSRGAGVPGERHELGCASSRSAGPSVANSRPGGCGVRLDARAEQGIARNRIP